MTNIDSNFQPTKPEMVRAIIISEMIHSWPFISLQIVTFIYNEICDLEKFQNFFVFDINLMLLFGSGIATVLFTARMIEILDLKRELTEDESKLKTYYSRLLN